MQPLDTTFIVHDVSQFPVIWQRRDQVRPGYSAQWQLEMDALLRQGQPFVVIFEEDQPEEAHEDRKQRGLWLKRNKTALIAVCRAVVGIEANAIKRAALKMQSAIAAKAFGVAMEIAASKSEAEDVARSLLC